MSSFSAFTRKTSGAPVVVINTPTQINLLRTIFERVVSTDTSVLPTVVPAYQKATKLCYAIPFQIIGSKFSYALKTSNLNNYSHTRNVLITDQVGVDFIPGTAYIGVEPLMKPEWLCQNQEQFAPRSRQLERGEQAEKIAPSGAFSTWKANTLWLR